MTARAEVQFDPLSFGVRVAIAPSDQTVLIWDQPNVRVIEEHNSSVADENVWLRLREDQARALYESLTQYFGHTGHDARALRQDYEAERRRVDKLIGWAIGEGARP